MGDQFKLNKASENNWLHHVLPKSPNKNRTIKTSLKQSGQQILQGRDLAPGLWPGWPGGKCSGRAGSCARGQAGMIRLGKIRSTETSHKHDCRNHITDNLHQCISRLSIQSFTVLVQSLNWINRHDLLSCGPVAPTVPVQPAATQVRYYSFVKGIQLALPSDPDQISTAQGASTREEKSHYHHWMVSSDGLKLMALSLQLEALCSTPGLFKSTPAQAQTKSSPKLVVNWSCSIVLKACTNKNSKTSSGLGPPFSIWLCFSSVPSRNC